MTNKIKLEKYKMTREQVKEALDNAFEIKCRKDLELLMASYKKRDFPEHECDLEPHLTTETLEDEDIIEELKCTICGERVVPHLNDQ